jgi:hypothetical protein
VHSDDGQPRDAPVLQVAGDSARPISSSKQNAQALVRYVERLYNDNIVRVLLRYSDDVSTIFWTEFALYGAFVQAEWLGPLL